MSNTDNGNQVVTCSRCAAHFRVDTVQLGDAGGCMRCLRCSHKWVVYRSDSEAPGYDTIHDVIVLEELQDAPVAITPPPATGLQAQGLWMLTGAAMVIVTLMLGAATLVFATPSAAENTSLGAFSIEPGPTPVPKALPAPTPVPTATLTRRRPPRPVPPPAGTAPETSTPVIDFNLER